MRAACFPFTPVVVKKRSFKLKLVVLIVLLQDPDFKLKLQSNTAPKLKVNKSTLDMSIFDLI